MKWFNLYHMYRSPYLIGLLKFLEATQFFLYSKTLLPQSKFHPSLYIIKVLHIQYTPTHNASTSSVHA